MIDIDNCKSSPRLLSRLSAVSPNIWRFPCVWRDFLALAAEPGGQSGQFAPQRRRVARQQPQRNT